MRLLLTLILASLIALLAACGNDDGDQDDAADADDQAAITVETDDAQDDATQADDQVGMSMEMDDETFLAAMIEHHEGAVEMAEIALERTERDELRRLAQEIIDAQEAEITLMQRWLNNWYGGDHADHGVAHEDMGMAMDMDELREAEPFDLAFIDAMIVHHEGAIDMAEAVRESTERDELREMAEEIIEVQEAEIEQMREWREAWFGN